ncbi:GTPase IMAP family member 9-like [Solea solea]|uniref:GTPase IMAP family member 9-like n=1 Tax=Solea solea TaxID=90069 RepID=UPI00272D654B|nr:GTPase IMAP family member 9-like [Solea solea]
MQRAGQKVTFVLPWIHSSLLSSGNTILGQERFESKPYFKAVTRQDSEATAHVFGRQIRVIDTPGLLQSQEQIKTLCVNVLRSSTPCLFLVVVRIEVLQKPEERRIVPIGRPAVGKSLAGNNILGCRRFEHDCDFDVVSTETILGSAEVDGRHITVVDTPGLTEDALNPEELYTVVKKMATEANPGPHAFVIVVRIGKVSEADVQLFQKLPPLLSDHDALKYTMVPFTHGDELRRQSIEDKVQASSCLYELLSRCRWRYHMFDNTQTRDKQQVTKLLNQIDDMVLDNGGEHYSSDSFRTREERSWSQWFSVLLTLMKWVRERAVMKVICEGAAKIYPGMGRTELAVEAAGQSTIIRRTNCRSNMK